MVVVGFESVLENKRKEKVEDGLKGQGWAGKVTGQDESCRAWNQESGSGNELQQVI